jgi:hypothetical protein
LEINFGFSILAVAGIAVETKTEKKEEKKVTRRSSATEVTSKVCADDISHNVPKEKKQSKKGFFSEDLNAMSINENPNEFTALKQEE